MLDELIVANLGLIEEAHLEPGGGLVVVTGETGTGKTLLLGALRLLLGSQARRDQVGPHGDEATVQARFHLGETEVITARRLSKHGRAKAYMDGLMVPLKALEERAAGAVELVAQHDHLRLTQPGEVREMLDGALDDSGREALREYREAWAHLDELTRRRDEIGGDRPSLERELEVARHQAAEIAAAGFSPGEDETLDRSAQRLRNAHGILEALDDAAHVLGEDTIEPAMDRVVVALGRAAVLDPSLEGLAVQAVDVASLLAELRTGVAASAGDVVADGEQLDAVETRLALLGDLRRKYGATLDAVLVYEATAAERAIDLGELLTETDTLDDVIAAATQQVATTGEVLRRCRIEAGSIVAGHARGHLVDLGFSAPVVQFGFTATTPGPGGLDRVGLLFASDAALDPAPVGRIASGGELSRLVLALRLAVAKDETSVVVFDEIDAGVGGAVALELARKLADLAEHRQVLCVTHLPQIAAFADTHYVVERSGSRAAVREATGPARVAELSRMLAGLPESDRGRDHAEELLANAGRERPAAH